MGLLPRYASLSTVSLGKGRQRSIDHRAELRVSCKGVVAIMFRGSHYLVPVLNRSAQGLMVKLSVRPRIGETVSLTFRGGQPQVGTFRWFHAGKAGIQLI